MARRVLGGTARWSRLNPRATAPERERALRVARALARGFARGGASAVVLAGSWARGDAHRGSDLDLWVLGRRRAEDELWYRDGFQVSIHRSTERQERSLLSHPRSAWGAAPGWRESLVLHDPRGIAARLKRAAEAPRPRGFGRACDRYVAREITSWCEEVHKLVRAMSEGEEATAAVQRNLLANHMAGLMAIELRMEYGTENAQWERVAAWVNGGWRRAQQQALGVDPVPFPESCRAAIELFAHTARELWPHLNATQRALVGGTCRAYGHPLPDRRPYRRGLR
jgi:hypothetical protein